MDRDSNYIAVGAFVLLVIAMGVAFVLWYTEHQDKRHFQRYEIYFEGSVSGLNQGSPVRYLGVDVGRVVGVALDPKQRNRVQVLADIDEKAPVDGTTLASLNLQGVTGLLFIDLEQDHVAHPAKTLLQGQRYPTIRSAPSGLDKLLSSLPQLAAHAADLVDRVGLVLTDDNIKAVAATLQNLRRTSDQLPKSLQEINLLVQDVRRSAQEVQAMAVSARGITDSAAPDIQQILARIRQVADSFADTAKELDRFIAENEKGVAKFTDQGLPEFERLLRESRDAAKDIRELSRSLKQNPSQLIYEPTYRGIEVPR